MLQDKQSSPALRRYRERRSLGLCGRCAAQSVKTLCPKCMSKNVARSAEKRAERRAQGLCTKCGKAPRSSPNIGTCTTCRATLNARSLARKRGYAEKGDCYKCGKHASSGASGLCLKCWWLRATTLIGYVAKKPNKQNSELVPALVGKMFSQRFRCALSGRYLTPGDNASLDHINPISSHPELSADLANLQWVSTEINTAKMGATQADFIKLCMEVAAHNGGANV